MALSGPEPAISRVRKKVGGEGPGGNRMEDRGRQRDQLDQEERMDRQERSHDRGARGFGIGGLPGLSQENRKAENEPQLTKGNPDGALNRAKQERHRTDA